MAKEGQQDGLPKVGLHNFGDIEGLLNSSNTRVSNESSAAVATPEEVDTVILSILAAKKMGNTQENYNRILLTSAHLCQIGATSPKFAESRMVTDYGVNHLSAGELKGSCSKLKITTRKYARSIRDYIIKVSQRHSIAGNLLKNYKLENPGCDMQDLVWVADFQTFLENPTMPEHVRSWLLQNYKNRFRPDSK